MSYYEGRDGKCVKTDEYSAGEAYLHPEHHVHMTVNEGRQTMKFTLILFDLPHAGPTTPPFFGNASDAADFTPLPPADCPRLR